MLQQLLRSSVRMVTCGLALGLLLPLSQAVAQTNPMWTIFEDDRGTVVQYPRGIFAVEAPDENAAERVLTTVDGRARLHISARRNERNESPAQYLRRVFATNRERLTYDRVTDKFFAVSVPHKGRIFYRRCNFANNGLIHCIELQYPGSEKRAWDDIVTRISLSLRPK
jgi:hypothetical protein